MFNKKLWEVEKERRGDLLCRDIECIMGNVVFLSSVLPLRPAGWVRLCSMATTSHTHTHRNSPAFSSSSPPPCFPALPLSRFPFRSLPAPPTHWRSICLADRNPYFSHHRYHFLLDPPAHPASTSLPSEPPSGHISSYMFT